MNLVDDIGRKLLLNKAPQRIVSLCPSITETLFDMGLGDLLVGRTDYCIHPAQKIGNVRSVGGPKSVSIIKVEILSPDIIFAVKEENPKETIEFLGSLYYNCFTFDINSFSDGLKMIETIGKIFGISYRAENMTAKISRSFKTLEKRIENVKFIYMVWSSPYIAVGTGNYIDSLLAGIGFTNCLSSESDRYVTMASGKLKGFLPDIVFLPSEPYNYNEADRIKFEKIFPGAHVVLVDGEMFCWYGSRMRLAAKYFENILKKLEY